MAGYVRLSSQSVGTIPRTQTTHVEALTFDDPTLPSIETALAEIRMLSEGWTATLTVSTDPQNRPVLTFTWQSF